ncbi:myb-related transcription factor, partner of profilin [Latimeria chalumnae]|uniref:myb-related transcription factor, partner of profilin n=1 Tax=Latimeria chalumnae TaxID=7897 RepID=UPI0003C138F7|nr:PREDICTED: myb-related transcription factor, partner of profilin-like [Latimeria chalumnae]XP_006014040.1 PREDICTED: myb-related transcription factor, partner of profilin-like [Latimeria chalumnae]|eukprot:XP_006014039.1 PREDICTED: myb-related transcription factor, partner of profilin-like [Latimeria chalumnae]
MASQAAGNSGLRERKRKLKFNHQELEILVEDVIKNYDRLFGAEGVRLTPTQRNKIWEMITIKTNAVGRTVRSIQDIKKRWADIKIKTKKKLAMDRKTVWRTGGVPHIPSSLSPLEQRVMSTFHRANLVSVAGTDTQGSPLGPPETFALQELSRSEDGGHFTIKEEEPSGTEEVVCFRVKEEDPDPLGFSTPIHETPVRAPSPQTYTDSTPGEGSFYPPLESSAPSSPEPVRPRRPFVTKNNHAREELCLPDGEERLLQFEQQLLNSHIRLTDSVSQGFSSISGTLELLNAKLGTAVAQHNRTLSHLARCTRRLSNQLLAVQQRLAENSEATNSLLASMVQMMGQMKESLTSRTPPVCAGPSATGTEVALNCRVSASPARVQDCVAEGSSQAPERKRKRKTLY